MEFIKLLANNIINQDHDGRYNFRSSLKDAHGPHYHDFYEMFLVVKGNAVHNVNGEKQWISDGSLVFVRPGDKHYYEQDTQEISGGNNGKAINGSDCQYINVTFRAGITDMLINCFKGCFDFNKLLLAPVSPCITLALSEKNRLKIELTAFNAIKRDDTTHKNAALRIMLSNIIYRYFISYDYSKHNDYPLWLRHLRSEMCKPENFIAGIHRMSEISNISREHIARVIKKYYGMSPSGFINDLRLNYAANLLHNSDSDIIDVCFDSGFNHLGYFYRSFGSKYKMTPAEYKKRNPEEAASI
ncbi:MAG: AraC family transcriptional regulator [Eubacteriales bacterium]|nr:AraC family transcriptional regulator [Eubacteriales bacterium]